MFCLKSELNPPMLTLWSHVPLMYFNIKEGNEAKELQPALCFNSFRKLNRNLIIKRQG